MRERHRWKRVKTRRVAQDCWDVAVGSLCSTRERNCHATPERGDLPARTPPTPKAVAPDVVEAPME